MLNAPLDTYADQFKKDGFLIVPHLFTAHEMIRLKSEIAAILAKLQTGEIGDSDGKQWKMLKASGVYVGLAPHSNLIQRLLRDDRLLDILEVMIGPNLEFLSDKIAYKDDDTDHPSPWHQDWPYWYGDHKISVWVALDDATVDNGCLKLIPGSHHGMATHDGEDDGKGFGNRLKQEAVDESQAVTASVERGGAVFFHDLALHASHSNTAQTDRWVWIPTYRDAQHNDPDYPFAIANTVVRGHR
ncbi:MAG: phytanoyl-CoA dioxygenase family protein [Chloroflexota bacterium]